MPVACLDGDNETLLHALREFFHTNGCTVFINEVPQKQALYHIVCADRETVKDIFLAEPHRGEKRLAIISGEDPPDLQWAKHLGSKVISIDTETPTSDLTQKILTFFFTSAETICDLRESKDISLHTKRHSYEHPHSKDDSTQEVVDVKPHTVQQRAEHIPSNESTQDDDKHRIEETIADVFKPQGPLPTRLQHKRKHTGVPTIILVIMGVLMFPILWYALSLGVSAVCVGLGGTFLLGGNTAYARHAGKLALSWSQQGKTSLVFIGMPLRSLNRDAFVRNQERLWSLVDDTAWSIVEGASLLDTGNQFLSSLMAPSGKRVDDESTIVLIARIRIRISSLHNSLGLAQANLEGLVRDRAFPFRTATLSRYADKGLRTLQTMRLYTQSLEQLLALYPQVAGFGTTKTYLVLLQNSMELRPTGGFIGSVATLSFLEGRMEELRVQDVYALDGQLRGHVEPPKPIRELLGQEHWYLRDSNWDPDFSVSAQRAAWFYEKEAGNSVSGVIGVSVPFVVELLRITGPIDLPDYNDRISADNFFGKSIYYTQQNFFPGSTQKKDFLGALTNALITNIASSKNVSLISLYRVFLRSLDSRDIQFYFSDSNIQTLVRHAGWAGSSSEASGCYALETALCTFDMVYVAEANMSINKVNFFIHRTQERSVRFSETGTMSETVTLTYQNTSSTEQHGVSGTYKPYLQALIPEESTIEGFTLDGKPIPIRDRSDRRLALLPYAEPIEASGSSNAWGIVFEVPSGEKRQVSFSFTRRGSTVPGQSSHLYELFAQKQPGITDDSYTLTADYPSGWRVVVETPETETDDGLQTPAPGFTLAKEGRLQYNTSLSHDILVRLRVDKPL